MRIGSGVLLTAAVATLVAGCAGGAGSSGSPSPDRPEIVVPTPSNPPANAKPIRLTGRIAEGVEAGCTVLRTDQGATYTLVGEVTGLEAAATVTVLGSVDPERVSVCQQGPVFVVSAVVTPGSPTP